MITAVDNANSGEDLYAGNLEKVARLWVNGGKIDWEQLYLNELLRRIPLPTYPFAKESFWLGGTLDTLQNAPVASIIEQTAIKEDDRPNKPETATFLVELGDAPEYERLELIEKYLQNMVAGLLAYNPPDVPELHQGFFDMGMESVMVANFQSSLEQKLEVKLSDSAIFDYPNIKDLSEYLLNLILSSGFEAKNILDEGNKKAAALFTELTPHISGEVPKEIDSMTPENVVRELKALLAELNKTGN